MAKRSVYFPDELEDEMREHPELPVSQICQDAVREALKGRDEPPLVRARRKVREAERIIGGEIDKKEEARKKRVKP